MVKFEVKSIPLLVGRTVEVVVPVVNPVVMRALMDEESGALVGGWNISAGARSQALGEAKHKLFRRIAKMTGMRGMLKYRDVAKLFPRFDSASAVNKLFRYDGQGLRQLIGQMGLKVR